MATKGNVKLVPDFDLQSPMAYMDRKFRETQIEDNLVSTGQDQSHYKVKISLLRNMMGSESVRILLSLPISVVDRNNYVKVKTAMEKYINPCVNEVSITFSHPCDSS
ncbi:hypothetical protein PR048_012672 [Dryococelus australis]|uniref:Uncharacterized protein n=1 Tax=Dryococelus australis TaxID=614101 RepID=A0ABQ9HQV9_9NEOP|nr:hypothetical protein PR048_012672 [Dryococelus australis]